jgi:putative ABC transport system permease protein
MRSHLQLPLPLLLALRAHLGRHRTPSLITLFAIAASVTLATALEMSTTSVEAELAGTAENLAGAAEVEIVGGTLGVSDELVAVVAAVSGVRIVAPLVTATLRINPDDASSSSVHVLGVDIRNDAAVRSYSPYAVAGESLPLARGDDAMLVSAPLARRFNVRTGDTLSVRLGGRLHRVTIRGILPPRGVAAAYGGDIGVMDVSTLQASMGRKGWLDRIDVVLSPGSSNKEVIEAIRSEIGGRGTVRRSAEHNAWVENALLMLQIIVSALIAVASLVASLVSYGALSWFVDRLTPELALLHAAGLEPQRLRRLLYIDAGLLAALGTGVGMVSGRLLSESFLRGLSWLSTFIQGVELQHLQFRASTLATGAVVGAIVSVVGVLEPARRASHLSPLDTALGVENRTEGQSGGSRKRALACGLIAVASVAAALPTGPPLVRVAAILVAGLAALGIAVDMVLPFALRASGQVLELILPGIGRLIGAGLAARRGRTVLTVACVGAVTAGVTMSLTLTRSAAHTLDGWLENQFNGGVFVTTDHIFSTQPREVISPETVAIIRQAPKVKAVFEEVSEKIIYRGEEALLVAGSMSVLGEYGKLQVVSGNPRTVAAELTNGQVAISERFARHFGTQQGDFVTLSTPKGAHRFRVAGLIRDYAGPAGSLNMDIAVFDKLWPRQGSRDVVFWTVGDPSAVIPAIRNRLTEQHSLVFTYGDGLAHFVTDQIGRLRGILASVALMTALLGAVAISSLMLSSVTTQARDRALVLALGATRAQIRVIKLLEGLLLGLGGGAAGIALGVGASYPIITNVLPEALGWALSFSADPAEFVLLISCLAASSLLASVYPAWIAGDVSLRELSGE